MKWPSGAGPTLGGDPLQFRQDILGCLLFNVHSCATASSVACDKVSDGIVALHAHASATVPCMRPLRVKQGPAKCPFFSGHDMAGKPRGHCTPSAVETHMRRPRWESSGSRSWGEQSSEHPGRSGPHGSPNHPQQASSFPSGGPLLSAQWFPAIDDGERCGWKARVCRKPLMHFVQGGGVVEVTEDLCRCLCHDWGESAHQFIPLFIDLIKEHLGGKKMLACC